MTLRGAISGFGEVAARAHLAGWRTLSDVSIVAIHEPVADRRHHALRLIRNVRVYDDLELMLDGERPDFVDIASPPSFHATAARMSLEAGAHVLVEKPLCFSLPDFEELRATAAKHNRVLMCVHNWKHAAPHKMAQELIAAGRIGEVRHAALERLRTAPAGVGESSGGRWRLGSESGGGILVDHGWHAFYLLRSLMGDGDPVSVSAWMGRDATTSVEDEANLRIIFPGNRVGSVHLSWRSPVRRTWALIRGSEAILEINGDRVTMTSRSGNTEDIQVPREADDSYHAAWFGAMAADFERAIREGSDSPMANPNLTEARACLALMLASRASGLGEGSLIKIV
jgi:predicted dehydrogenase